MKSLLNQGLHELLKLAHTPVACSEAERISHLKCAAEINQEINAWLPEARKYEHVGLGQNCNASWYLKSVGKKQSSYPFDWIFTTPEIILDILNDDFEALKNKSLLIPHGLDAGHEKYHEWLFGHRNPASSTSDLDYLKRCIKRWHVLMTSQKPILFLTIVLNEHEKRKRWKEGFTKEFKLPAKQTLDDFETMMKRLQAINPNCKFLFIEQYTTQKFELTIENRTESAFWLKFSAIDKNTGVQYLHAVDDEVMKTILKT